MFNIKGIIATLLLATVVLTMSINSSDPMKNMTILRVLAAYQNKGIYFNQAAG